MTSSDQPTQPTLPRPSTTSSLEPTIAGDGPGTGSNNRGINEEAATAATIPAAGATWGNPQADVLTGQAWGDFLVGTLLGRGGMGAVYRGRQQSLDRDVAIKVLPPHLSDNEGFRSRFQLEAKAVASLDSPHIIKVYGAGQASGHNYFAMEYVEGDDLAVTVRKKGRPTQLVALDWVLQAARGLQAAGELGIVHRDIKPANMMLTRRGVVKLMDFGLVRSTKEAHGLTMTGTVMGTVSYFSPEQGRGDRCDSRTDLYALGVVFYEFLTGRLPFTGEDPTSIIYQHIHVAPTPPREIDPGIPEDFQAVCLKCLQKNAEDRYRNAGELVADLERLGRGDHPRIDAAELMRLQHGTTLYVPKTHSGSARRSAPWIIAAVVVASVGAAAVWAVKPASTLDVPLAPTPIKPVAPITAALVATPVAPPLIIPQPAAQPVTQTITQTITQPAAPITHQAPPPVPVLVNASSWAPKVQELIAARHFSAARALISAHPEDTLLAPLSRVVDQSEGAASLSYARTALQSGDFAAAATQIEAARALLGANSTEALELAQEIERRSQRAGALLEEAKAHALAGRIAEAQVAVTKARSEAPQSANLANVEALVQREADRLAQTLASRDAVRASGEQALASGDLDRADIAFAEALRLDPTDGAATAGQRTSTSKRAALMVLAQRVSTAVKAKDLTAATQALAPLLAQAPNLALTADAQKQVSGLSSELAAIKAAAEAQEAQLVAAAATLGERARDLRVPLAQLEHELADFLVEAGAQRRERPALEALIELRRQRERFVTCLAKLDAAVLGSNAAVIAKLVSDPELAASFTALGGQDGLVFASQLVDFKPHGEHATARIHLRTAMTSFPETTLTYTYDLARTPDGWVVTAGQRTE
jgi:predicted Ser/Thr protein kinase